MNEEIISLCRLCLKSHQDLEIINDGERDMIEIVVPQIVLDLFDNADICKNCADTLQQSFTFKSKCLDIEDSIQDYKKTDQDKIDLETILGVGNADSDSCIRICRTCLESLRNDTFIEPTEKNGLKNMFQQCLPELNIELTVKPVICPSCEGKLKNLFDFFMMCLKTEGNLMIDQNLTDMKKDDSYDTKVNLLTSEEIIKDECSFNINHIEGSVCSSTGEGGDTNKSSQTGPLIYCQFCHYGSNSESAMRTHIFSCPVFLKTEAKRTKRKAATAKTRKDVDTLGVTPKVEKITDTNFDKNAVYVLSDSDEENSGKRPKRRCTILRKSTVLSDTEDDTESDYEPGSGTDSSNDSQISTNSPIKAKEKKITRSSIK